MDLSPVLTAVLVAFGLVLLLGLLVVQRVKVAGPNDAFIITGRKGRPVRNPETGQISTDMSGQKVVTVSYTHLTLPTILLV